MDNAGYYRFPTIHKQTVVFVCEDDLWSVPADGGFARRLTANRAEVTHPVLSPDGRLIAYAGREEGQSEVYVMPATGGPSRRLTYQSSAFCQPLNWTQENRIVFTSSAAQPFAVMSPAQTVDIDTKMIETYPIGPVRAFSAEPSGGVVIGRNSRGLARWKRYRGGTVGQIWIDQNGNGEFQQLSGIKGNLDAPMWLGERIYFLSDHEGISNLYSCLPDQSDIRRHTDHDEYYARNAKSDGQRIVYHSGADLFVFDPISDKNLQIPIDFGSSQTQRNRKFVSAAAYLEGWKLHPNGHSLSITSRGKAYAFPNWEGAAVQRGHPQGARYRLLTWLNDGERQVAVSDAGGEESFVILRDDQDGIIQEETIEGLDTGRPIALAINPQHDIVAFSNHRYELMLLDLESRNLQQIDRGKSGRIAGFSWSPDGQWIVYSVTLSNQVSILKLWNRETLEATPITSPVLRDVAPAFDHSGKNIYFLSYREFDPIYDNLHFDLSFPRGVRPYVITLRKEDPSPFQPQPPVVDQDDRRSPNLPGEVTDEIATGDPLDEESEEAEAQTKEGDDSEGRIRVDLDGIVNRITRFPIPEGRYGRIMASRDGKVLYTRFPIEGALNSGSGRSPAAKGTLFAYDFGEQKEERLLGGVTDFDTSRDGTTLVYRSGNRLRVLKAGSKPNSNSNEPGRQSGWIDLSRVKISIIPSQEWGQMYRETWRLQRDQHWSETLSEVDWIAVYDKYLPLLDRVASRSEFSDLIWEMQGELGTSHAYESGGDYRPEPRFAQGFLGADFAFDPTIGNWIVTHVVRGDPWDEKQGSPLMGPGIEVSVGDRLLAINGRALNADYSPQMALVSLAGQEIRVTFAAREENPSPDKQSPRTMLVKALPDESPARYRDWVEENRRIVREASDGQVGYLHIPDMVARGYAEFHRGFLAEIDRAGLIVDVRYNGGGHVSQLILEKLARRRIGYNISRWGETPSPYPGESVFGPIVALTNEWAGSDGDIFSHSFKLMKLGPLIGTRTWGGVVGIFPRHPLVDGTVTTQPEFSFWFEDVGWGVENYGTDPDIVVDNRPQDYLSGTDAQLNRAIEEIVSLLAKAPKMPTFSERPNLSLPTLPRRPTSTLAMDEEYESGNPHD